MKLRVVHESRYAYASPVRYSAHYLRLTPRDTARQKVLSWRLETPGEPVRTLDGYGNVLHVLTLDKPMTEIAIRASGTVETSSAVDEPSDFTGTPLSPLIFLRVTPLTRADEKLAATAEGYRRRAGTLAGLRELAATIRKRAPEAAPEPLVHAFVASCRFLAVPARFVSGFLCAGTGAPHAAPHAWAEAWVVDRWRSFDIAGGVAIGEGHVKIAFGADVNDARAIRSVRTGGGAESVHVETVLQQ